MTSSKGDFTCRFWSSFSPRLRVQPSAALLPPRISVGLGLGYRTSLWCQQPVLGQSPPCPLGATSRAVSFTEAVWWWSFIISREAGGWKLDLLEDANRYSGIKGWKNGILRRLWDHLCISDWMALLASCFQTKTSLHSGNGGPLFEPPNLFLPAKWGQFPHELQLPVILAKNHPNASAN